VTDKKVDMVMTVTEAMKQLAELPGDAELFVLAGEDGRPVDFAKTTVVGKGEFYYNSDAPYCDMDEDEVVVVIGSTW
jgi:hypothetical protein